LAASFSSATGFSIAVAYGVQPLLNAGAIVLCATGLAWELLRGEERRRWRGAALCGVLALGGAGLYWLFGLGLARDLWDTFVLHHPPPPPDTPFRWLAYMIRNMYANPPLMMLGHRPTSLGIAGMWGFLLACHGALHAQAGKRRFAWVMAAGGIAGMMALTLETSFAMTLLAAGIFCLLCVAAPSLRAGFVLSGFSLAALFAAGCPLASRALTPSRRCP
jgi:hypothetical protein